MNHLSTLLTAWKRYWFAPRSLIDLAVMRIVAVGLQLVLLISSWPVGGEFARLHQNVLIYKPLSVVRLFTLPFGRQWMPPVWGLHMIFWFTAVAGCLCLIGLFTKPSLIVFAWGSVVMQAFQYSFGHFHHPEAIMMFALIALSLSPCGAVWSIDSLRKAGGCFGEVERTSPFAGWPIIFVQWMFVLIYASAAYSKLRHGLVWLNGYTLQYYLAQDALRWDRPAGMWLAEHHFLVLFFSWMTVLFEATFVSVMIFPKLRWFFVPVGLCFHAAIYFLQAAPFFQLMALYSVFVPWSRIFQRNGPTQANTCPANSKMPVKGKPSAVGT